MALSASKVSVLVFTRRIFSGNINKEKIIFGIGYGLTAVYGVCAILLSSASCDPERALVPKSNAVCAANVSFHSSVCYRT